MRSIYISAIAALVMNLAMISALPKKGDAKYGEIIFGTSADPFLVNAAPRLISSAVGSGTAKLLVLIAVVGQLSSHPTRIGSPLCSRCCTRLLVPNSA